MQITTKQKTWLEDVPSMASMPVLQASNKQVNANLTEQNNRIIK